MASTLIFGVLTVISNVARYGKILSGRHSICVGVGAPQIFVLKIGTCSEVIRIWKWSFRGTCSTKVELPGTLYVTSLFLSFQRIAHLVERAF